jgi:PAS domain S-box-containing protein
VRQGTTRRQIGKSGPFPQGRRAVPPARGETSDLLCLHEPDGRYLYISPSCRRLLGYESEALLGTDPYDLFHPEDLERIRSEAHEKALDGQGAVSVTYRICKESGEYVVRDPNGADTRRKR